MRRIAMLALLLGVPVGALADSHGVQPAAAGSSLLAVNATIAPSSERSPLTRLPGREGARFQIAQPACTRSTNGLTFCISGTEYLCTCIGTDCYWNNLRRRC